MMDKDALEKSFVTLKQTIPLLLKYNIAAIPPNYALWYTYASNESEALNIELDATLAEHTNLSEAKTEDLYRTYVAEKQEVNVWQLRQSLEAMLIELDQSTKDTRSDTDEFKQLVDKNLDRLASVEKEGLSVKEVMQLVKSMVRETQAMRQSAISFNGALRNAEKEITRLREQLQESQREALYDALTGLCNRRYFDSELSSKAEMENLALLLVDIDHFKSINDDYGHQTGDLVLKAVARQLQTNCREQAQAFRYGGEEFAVIFPGAKLSAARQLAETMRRAVEKVSVKDKRKGQTVGDITVSVGVATLEQGESVEAMVARADKRLYEAKRLGRNRVMPLS